MTQSDTRPIKVQARSKHTRTSLMSLFCATLALALIGRVTSVAAATKELPPALITRISEANQWLRDPGKTNTIRSRLTGVVVYVDPRNAIVLQEGSDGIWVWCGDNATLPSLGDQVAVEGLLRFLSTNAESVLTATRLENLGKGKMPEPAHPWLIDALNGKNDRQWIEVSAVLMQSRMDGDLLSLHLTDEQGWALAVVANWPKNLPWTNGWGAHLRLQGANIGRGNRSIRVPSPQQITVLTPGSAHLFDTPLVAAETLRGPGKNSPKRARVQATVLRTDVDAVYLRSGEIGFRASLLQPFSTGSPELDLRELLPAPIPQMLPGDHVEVVGSPLRTQPYLTLNFSSFRLLGSNTPPAPTSVQAPAILNGVSANDLVRVSGRLISRDQIMVKKIAVETLKLESESVVFQALLESVRGGQLKFLNEDERVEVTGMVIPLPSDPGYSVRLTTAADARSLGIDPSVTRQKLWRISGGVGATLLLALAWIFMLRRRVAHRTTELKFANDKLQYEIAEGQRAGKIQRATYEISEAVHQADDLKSFYLRVHHTIQQLMPADNFFLLLHKPKTDLYEYAYHVDQVDAWPAPRRVEAGLVGYILRSGSALLADRASMTDPANEWYLVSGTPSAVWLGVPLAVGGQTIGVMAVQDYHNPVAYGQEEKRILTYVAAQTALAIERKRSESALATSEAELRQSERRFRTAFDANPAMMTVTRLDDGRFVAANAAFFQASGFTEPEVVGQLARDLNIYAIPEQRQEFVELLRKDGFVRNREHRIQKKDGSAMTVLTSGEVIQMDGAPHTLAVGIDISTRKQAEQDMRRALETERELGELKSRFVSLVSHEFRTPLGITMSAVELLRNYLDRLPPAKLSELLEDIYSSTLRMSGLMEQVLLLGRVEAAKIGFKVAPIDLASLAGKLVDEIHSATHRRCPIHFRAEGDLSHAVADESLLRHILSNLLSNAVKYSPDGKPVAFTLHRQQTSAVFMILDRGIGIPSEDQGRLFEAFHRGSNVGQISGTGLGLMIVKRCVDLHQGLLQFESTPGEGSCFSVSLPLFTEQIES